MKQPKPGRPKFEATSTQRNQVTALVACGVPRKQVAQYIGVDLKTLSKHFTREIREAARVANAKVATVLYQKALGGDTVSMLFWLKCRAGWREGSRLELTGPDGKPIEPPKLGISFIDGGPGRVRTTPFKLPESSDNEGILLAPDAPDRLDNPSPHVETDRLDRPSPHAETGAKQTFLPKPETPKPTPSLWERLAMTPAEFSALPDQKQAKADETLRAEHIHVAKPDSTCPRCRAMWVAQ
jgi:hypothetical protein